MADPKEEPLLPRGSAPLATRMTIHAHPAQKSGSRVFIV